MPREVAGGETFLKEEKLQEALSAMLAPPMNILQQTRHVKSFVETDRPPFRSQGAIRAPPIYHDVSKDKENALGRPTSRREL